MEYCTLRFTNSCNTNAQIFNSIGSFRNHAISKARIIVKEVYGLGFGDTLNKVLELLEKFNFTALD